MTQGDNLFGKKTVYKHIEFRSRLETTMAFILDKLKIKLEYEPKRFVLSNGIFYVPDFYLPELKTWLEVKGKIESHNRAYSKLFVEDNHEPLILISPDEFYYYGDEWLKEGEAFEDDTICIGKCESCGSFYFSSNLGDYRCKKCNVHNGDHNFHHGWILCHTDYGVLLPRDINSLEQLKREVESGSV